MKKIYLSAVFTAISGFLLAQLPVSQTPENKNVVLEEFTGIACVYCPSGHAIAQQLSDDNPGDVVLINIHTGGYASPQGPGTDFRTAFGTAIFGLFIDKGFTIENIAFVGGSYILISLSLLIFFRKTIEPTKL